MVVVVRLGVLQCGCRRTRSLGEDEEKMLAVGVSLGFGFLFCIYFFSFSLFSVLGATSLGNE